ncbi:MAG: hypothetical protein Q4F99_05400 [bacterium]|nr:hypothetical protein [bacterium]
MTADETRRFLDCLTYEDNTIKLYGKVYWCLGVTYDQNTEIYAMYVYEGDPVTYKSIRDLFAIESTSRDECMQCFIEDKFWDGKSFYEVASDIDWVDL